MSDLYDSICITSVAPSVAKLCGVPYPQTTEAENKILVDLWQKKTGGRPIDRVVLFNPDAVALWLFQKYTDRFSDAFLDSDLALPMLSVMPSVTPVCFASMYSGVMPEVHGIRRYEKPVLTIKTLFDWFIEAGKKVAICSTAGDSISEIFLKRNMDYYIYESEREVNEKALSLIEQDEYDLIVIYNGDFDYTMHHNGPESEASLEHLKMNLDTYAQVVKTVKEKWKNHDALYGFLPDHGCHEIDGDSGSHGLDMQEDMNIIHFYGVKPATLE